MKRYDKHDGGYMDEEDSGEWVRYGDVAVLINALNLISDGTADDECASPLTKEDMMRIASHALSAEGK
jgi:hypothetical protein